MIRIACVVSFAALPVLAQSTLTVGPGGFAQIGDAIVAASDGDTIVVLPGTYLPFSLDKALLIVAPDGATVRSTSSPPDQETVIWPPTGQTATLSGLAFTQADALHPDVVRVTRGQAAFEDCAFSPTHPFESWYTLQCDDADLVLVRCSFEATNGAVRVRNGSLTASVCDLIGVDPGSSHSPMPAALRLIDADASLAFCTVRGGNSILTGQQAGPGVHLSGASTLRLIETAVSGGDVLNGAQVPSVGIVNESPAPVAWQRSTFVGGWGSIATPLGTFAVRGAGIVGPAQETPLFGLADALDGLAVGGPYGLIATAPPLAPVAWLMSFALTPPLVAAPLAQPLRCDPLAAVLLGAGLADGDGHAFCMVSWSLPVAALGTPLWFHGVAVTGAAWPVSNPVGGLLR